MATSVEHKKEDSEIKTEGSETLTEVREDLLLLGHAFNLYAREPKQLTSRQRAILINQVVPWLEKFSDRSLRGDDSDLLTRLVRHMQILSQNPELMEFMGNNRYGRMARGMIFDFIAKYGMKLTEL